MRTLRWLTMGLLTRVLCSLAMAADMTVIDYEKDFDLQKLTSWDVKVAVGKSDAGAVLKVNSGHKEPWPGITFKAPGGVWDLAKFVSVAVDVKNTGTEQVQVFCRVDNAGADGAKNCLTEHIVISPNERRTLTVRLTHQPSGQLNVKLFGMNGYPREIQMAAGAGIDPAKINQILVFLAQPPKDYHFEIGAVRAGGEFVPPPPAKDLTEATFFPFIDTFGQYIHADWPGKVHSLDELEVARRSGSQRVKAKPEPPDADKYGGWKNGPALEATGFFRATKHDGKWWLVDPDGKLFFSNGIDCITEWQDTPIDERETWFQDFPGETPEFKGFAGKAWMVVHGHYEGQHPQMFSFSAANLKRKYGDDWKKQVAEIAQTRLRSWGLNTIGAWSSPDVYNLRKTPYTVILHTGGKMIEGSEGYWGKFHDVFDPSFEESIRKLAAEQKGKGAGDPWCLAISLIMN